MKCVICRKRPPKSGRQRCESCLARVIADANARVADGRCRACGVVRERIDRLTCDDCRKLANDSRKSQRDRKIADGLCVVAGCRRKSGVTRFCETCRKANAEYHRAYAKMRLARKK